MSAAAPTPDSIWAGRTAIIATQHGKERVIGPLLLFHLGLSWRVPPDFNTDLFGTFTGEVERVDDPITTLRKKITTALDETGETLGIGNEGSFGPHPEMPWIPGDQELLMLIDKENKLEVVEMVTTTETNYSSLSEITSWEVLENFAKQVLFPSHGLILKSVTETGIFTVIKKGIADWSTLRETFDRHQNEKLMAETDMRANYNPTRLNVIEQVTRKLIQRLETKCPQCGWPAFGEVSWITGLPCENCNRPTRLGKFKLTTCQHCGFIKEDPATSPLASAQFCDFCNP